MKDTDLHYIDPFSLLFVDDSGTLKRIFCPFVVDSIFQPKVLLNKLLTVDMVRKNPDNEIFFIIEGKALPHYFFTIDSS
ncbi:hypothetical protein [Dyadobacter sp. 3J3]|uniref:hypothetical protein n=1 Tax=Dyadobacter sp. 3J3 TaxID=2606600 RepID=UPI00135B902A|nr:hypothetical protein [Dyadobacter sp. 3J3]